MDLVQSFPLLLSGREDILSLPFVLGHQLLCVCWVFISATDYSYFCKTSINLQPAKQGLFSVTSGIVYSSRLHEICLNFAVQIF